jgi:hypothetical protein
MEHKSKLKESTITEKKIKDKIKKLRPKSAAGPDRIGPGLLQNLIEEVAPALKIIYERSLEEGEVPEDWKTANVTPIFKKGVKSDPGNYRPVSLTSVCCKLLESIIRDDIVHHLLQNELLRSSQHGFMANKSCTTNLLEFLETLTSAVDEGDAMDVIFLDFAKAFDKVPHKRLMAQLKGHGVEGKVLKWIGSWLAGRRQRVVLNGASSGWKEVLSGVPQGSVLGPILFLVFINNLDVMASMVTVLKKFADDTKLGHVIKSLADSEALQGCLDQLTGWAQTWGMEFNVKKCKVMHLGNRNPGYKYTMAGTELGTTKEERDIGVMVSNNLKPSAQCHKAAKTAAAVLAQISRAFHFRDRHTFVNLYKQYVRPHIEFAVQAWSPWTQQDKEALETVQKRAVSMVSGLSGGTYEEKLRELGLTTLEERRHQADMVQVYKIVTGKDGVNRESWFKMAAEAPVQTRQAAGLMNLVKPRARLEMRANFFSVRVCDSWNGVPDDIKMARSTGQFKHLYKKYRESRPRQ